MSTEAVGAVLVCGAGIAGIQSALDLAESGFKVYLLDSSPAIGGRMAELDKTFPTGDCAMCILSPKLVECARNPNIEILTLADVTEVTGEPGEFKVRIRQNPRFIDAKKCDACGSCSEVCPVRIPSEFEPGLGTRKAVFRPYPQSIPNVYSISKSAGVPPCKAGCPAGVNVPGYVALAAAGKIREAYDLIRKRCPLPATAGRVCLHPCQDRCNRGKIDQSVSARNIERFVADFILESPGEPPRYPEPAARLQHRVAVVGGGPAGLTASADLALMGYQVTLFESRPQLGGLLRYGIPAYRLPKGILDKEIEHILGLGVEVAANTAVTRPKQLLAKTPDPEDPAHPCGFDAAFVATGAWTGRRLGIPGEDATGVLEGLRFLNEVNAGNAPEIGPRVLVVGDADLAMHAARSALRMPGVDAVHLACLESDPGTAAEALEEGVVFHGGLGATRFETREGRVAGVVFRACTSVRDEFGKFDPIYDDSRVSVLEADTVVVAVGRAASASSLGLQLRPGGRILADSETLATSVAGIFAGGDAVLGPGSMIEAVSQGHRAAESVHAYLRGAASIRGSLPRGSAEAPAGPGTEAGLPQARPEVLGRPHGEPPRLDPGLRKGNFLPVELPYSREAALAEAERCLSCGLCSECMLCVSACDAGAVLHEQQPAEFDLKVGSIIFAPGVEEFRASLWKEYGHRASANVLTSLQFERMLSATGPTGGRVERPSDGREPRRIAFIQCVGSRDASRGCGYCSSICCMSAVKEAVDAREHRAGDLGIAIFGMDLRANGKEPDGYVQRAFDHYGFRHVRAVPSRVTEIAGSANLRLDYRDPSGSERSEDFDLVVLCAGTRASARVRETARLLGIDLDGFGFARTGRFSPVATSRPGIFVAGTVQEPKDIPDSVAQGSAAAACAMSQLTAVRGTMIRRNEYPWERDTADEAPRLGVFVCHCGHNIASVVDVDWVAKKASKMPDVCYSEANTYTCAEANQQRIKELIRKHRLNRLVVASCSSRTHEALFQETLRQSGLNKYLFAMTNIRDQCSWVHRDNPAAATAKALDLVSMAVARARRLKALPLNELPVTSSALILGGGLAGMTAALNLADQGFQAVVVEREAVLGGLLRRISETSEQADAAGYLGRLVDRVASHPRIRVCTRSRLLRISGQVGNFLSVIETDSRPFELEHGVVIIATGGEERKTSMYLHGKNAHVLTQSGLESVLSRDELLSAVGGRPDPTIAMIQCVESRNEQNPYCSRVCCSEAVKNALRIRRAIPGSKVVLIGRDFRTYGLREQSLESAVAQGVLLVRHAEGSGPEVSEQQGRLRVEVRDLSGNPLSLQPDLLVLSAGIAPASDNAAIAGMLRSALSVDGFFLEAHPKLRPVDLANEGEFVCGLAHSPRFVDETISQAQAAAARAATILSKPQLEIVGQVACVNPATCVACATCVKICPFGAPMINEVRKSEIHKAKCTGCGSCAAACPAKAIFLQHEESETVSAMLDEILVGGGQA